jgi:hypothetical protein
LVPDDSERFGTGFCTAGRIRAAASARPALASVCYYLNLFGAFALSMLLPDSPFAGKLLTSLTLILVAFIGTLRGLRGLERAESLTVAIKLAVIPGMLARMAYSAWGLFGQSALQSAGGHVSGYSLRLAFGLIITVQGFETSRYLREAHDADTRIRTMRYAQLAVDGDLSGIHRACRPFLRCIGRAGYRRALPISRLRLWHPQPSGSQHLP